jgi:mRNA-degrading endonuclease RelE of RelBE toxin-antitoxin system
MSRTDRERILSAINSLDAKPGQQGVEKIEGTKTLYRYRVGGRRIIFNRDGADIGVLDIAPRGQAYDIRRLQQLDKD